MLLSEIFLHKRDVEIPSNAHRFNDDNSLTLLSFVDLRML